VYLIGPGPHASGLFITSMLSGGSLLYSVSSLSIFDILKLAKDLDDPILFSVKIKLGLPFLFVSIRRLVCPHYRFVEQVEIKFNPLH
jgi:hypothetical protein